MGRIENRTAIISGGQGAIGQAIAACFIREGARVYLLVPDGTPLQDVCRDLDPGGDRLIPVVGEPADKGDLEGLAGRAVEETGRIDILVNNPERMGFGSVTAVDEILWTELLNANLHGPWQSMAAVIPYMKKAGGGVILTISSLAGGTAHTGAGAYCVSHAALQMLCRVMAKEVSPLNIRVNLICPALVEDAGAVEMEGTGSWDLTARNGNPEDVADAALHLVSDQSAWLTGITLELDGGRHQIAQIGSA